MPGLAAGRLQIGSQHDTSSRHIDAAHHTQGVRAIVRQTSIRIGQVTAAGGPAVYAPPGWLLFVQQNALVVSRFDVAAGAVAGDLLPVAGDVGGGNEAAVSASATGVIAYRPNAGGVVMSQLTWVDRTGTVVGTMGGRAEGFNEPRLSPDGRRVVVGRGGLWLIDEASARRLTSRGSRPLWSPDGSQLVFSATVSGGLNSFQKPSTTSGGEELLFESPQNKAAMSFSRDGRFLFYTILVNPGWDIGLLRMSDRKSFAWLASPASERRPQFSPDGRWVVYESDPSGRPEIHVTAFSEPGTEGVAGQERRTWPVSTDGGVSPRWQHDGKGLHFIAPNGILMAASVVVTGTSIEFGKPTALFQTHIVGGGTPPVGLDFQYDVARDGRFLINVDQSDTAPITIIQNWKPKP